MFPTNINVEMMVRTAILAVEDYEFINFATNEWTLHGQDITNMILSKINMTPSTQSPEEVARMSVDKIVEQMKYKFAKQKEAQQCFYNTSILHQQQPPRLYTEPQINLVQQYLEEVQRILMDISSKFNTVLGTVAIYEMIWHIMQMLSQMKNGLYARFYFQVWYDQSAHTIRVELHDPFDMIPEDKKILGISVKTRDVPAPVEPPKPQEPPKEDDPFEDVPKDEEEEDVPSVRECVKKPSVPVTNIGHRARADQKTALLRREMNLRILYALKQKGVERVSTLCIGGFLEEHITPVQHKNLLTTLYKQGLIQKSGTTINARYRLTQKGEEVCASLEPIQLSWLAWFDNMLGDADEEWKIEFYNTLRDTKKAVFPYYKHYTHKREYRRLFYTGIIQADPNNGRCGCKEDTFSYTDLGEFVKSELKKEMEDNDAN